MPVAAQAATQHWYRSGTLIPEGETVPLVTFGGESNLSQNGGLGEFNCRTVGAGIVENPVGGGAGDGRSNSGGFYECKASQCEEKVKLETGLEGRGTATLQNEPASTKEPAFPGWTNLLEESTIGGVSSVREKIGEPFVTFKTHSPPGMIRTTVDCTIAANQQVVAEAIFEGELKPEIGVAKGGNLNGSSASKPSAFRFSGGSTGVMHSQLGGEASFLGNLKYLGYNEQEVITVRGNVLALKLTPEGTVITNEWVFPAAERKVLTIENPSTSPAELVKQQIETTEGVPNFTPVFLGPPEPPNCSMFSNPPVVTLPAGGKCNVAVESAGHVAVHARYILTFKEPKGEAKTIELKITD
jgi:hypothetical protein